MTDEQIRIAVAEVCGWEWCRIGTEEKPHRMLCIMNPAYTVADMTEPVCNTAYMWSHGRVPEYPNDLNACHEMTAALDATQKRRYVSILAGLIDYKTADDQFAFIEATARQRCEAFLRTLNLWKESP